MLKLRRGQSVLEYAILMVIIIAALLTLQTYIKRGIQGRLHQSADDIGDQFTTANGANYMKVYHTSSSTNEYLLAGRTQTKMLKDSRTNTVVKINSAVTSGEYWGSK